MIWVIWVFDWFTQGTLNYSILSLTESARKHNIGDHIYKSAKAQDILGWKPTPWKTAIKEVCDDMILGK